MSQRVDTRKAPPATEQENKQKSQRLGMGTSWPNLVFIRDLEKMDKVEFRVQCEVVLPFDEAREAEDLLTRSDPSVADLERALEIVQKHADKARAQPEFK